MTSFWYLVRAAFLVHIPSPSNEKLGFFNLEISHCLKMRISPETLPLQDNKGLSCQCLTTMPNIVSGTALITLNVFSQCMLEQFWGIHYLGMAWKIGNMAKHNNYTNVCVWHSSVYYLKRRKRKPQKFHQYQSTSV